MRAKLVLLVLIWALAACEDPDRRQLSELGNPDYIAECQRVRDNAGPDAMAGLLAHACYRSAILAGSCNMIVFDNCKSQPPSPCLAPEDASPLRTCSATISEYIACELAMAKQFPPYRGISCAMPPTTSPKLQRDLPECASVCRKCPTYPGCQ